MTQFRPCIDLHQGQVKQIVGGSLTDQGASTNFVSSYDAAYYSKLYQKHQLTGGHVIALGAGNQEQALSALSAWPNGLQFGGGVNNENAASYLEAGASHVIVTSYLFENGEFSWERLEKIKQETGIERLVLDLSCRKTAAGWHIATDRWQTVTSLAVNNETLQALSQHCAEFLIHAADVEGLQAGIDEDLVRLLGQSCPIPVTYAGGARALADLALVHELSNGKVDLTIGSALDIFGGKGITLADCIQWNQQHLD
ncbi:1-(5-phosphoribosyl)-5-[(5-phosphoribosylamino)methylideneamino] imidazole-4-carboxamide isomerase [Oceanospirillum multiglobuliferum]|uniref:Phosphoribosylformimino-5-aminoimidazole carboxamide ribotide isomerase n=1 Tax=Oceanospirillum multiglobuliferum TaxID=64969 RepID=A0A1T4MU37_9GAMM|nr:phosphoribosylformimino-5-aminoimidazole carboxamide ribotide isomerase [Oceanospirillum multiglobuliferum]OPX56890.1 phosphoribosylformimino-5-aminoimidazole carboxamide ribotide isomerase [Oceanospirillum multiglobuliferum]SJZ70502.1 1-(5-phosphoribosyl)-5-[(5-phosphoribosylamino)methylideneamino] imidazole-4-carboxamide isomerase [Oceanospirillum multiglobuliferum]